MNMRIYFTLLLFGAFFNAALGQTTILDESLRSGSAPGGWSASSMDFRTSAGGYALFEQSTSTLETPVLDLSGFTGVELTFSVAKFGSGSNGPITVEVSDDGGTTWTAQTFDSPTPTSSSYFTSGPTTITATGSNVKIRFIRANSPSQKRLRDVVLTGSEDNGGGGSTTCPQPSEVFINEFHYDDAGADVNEFVEVAVSNTVSPDLSSLTVTLYNGSNGTTYGSATLDEFTAGDNDGTFTYYTADINTLNVSGIQNGAPDGLSLDCNGTLLGFLSYEGSFQGEEGPANGVTSTDVNVSESSSASEGSSIQLVDGAWVFTDGFNTMGSTNEISSIVCPTTDDIFISEFHYDNPGTDVNEFVEVAVSSGFEGDLSSIEVVLYNGSNGASYNSESLDNLSFGSTAGDISYYFWDLPTNGLQNGSPDGIALECNGEIFQLLSYEGDMTVDGFASTNVGVTEGGGTSVEGSLQLIDGVWTETCQNTKGDANADVDCCEDPTFECLDNDVVLDFGSYNLTEADVVDIDNQDNPADCPEITLDMISPSTLTCDDLDQTVMVTVMVNTPEGPQSCTANISVVGESGELPSPWSASDVGNGTNEFGYEVCNANNGQFSLVSGGTNWVFPTDEDDTGFIWQEICGDGSITVKVESVQDGLGGIAIRESNDPGARMYSLFTDLAFRVFRSRRTATGANSQFRQFFKPHSWLRLERKGNLIWAYSSLNGVNFSVLEIAVMPMDNCLKVGMAVSPYSASTPGSAVFSQVTVTGGSGFALSQEVQETINGISLKNGAAPQPGNGTKFDIPATERGQATLFPNPTTGALNLRFEEAVEARTTVVVRNQFGQALQQQQVGTGAVQTQLDVSTLPAGLYLLEVQGQSGLIQTLRFNKQ